LRRDAAEREARFAALVNRQARFVFRVAYAVLRHAHDAEDVVQETFLKLYRAGGWDAIENERAFLARAAWRLAADKLKATRRPARQVEAEVDASGAANPEQEAVAADWNAVVERLMDGLPQELRQPLALAAIEEMSSREIAGAMGIAEGTVRTRIMRARQILKQRLARVMGRPL